MPGMFYSLKEVSEKLGKTEDEVRQIVKNGQLREFRDGPNLLFKVDEVQKLLNDTSITEAKQAAAPKEEKPSEAQPEAKPQPQAEAEEILLAPDTETPAKGDAETGSKAEEIVLSDADTQIVEEGIKVLGDETDTASALKDSGAGDETFKGLGGGSGSPGKEASLEEIEKDVSLDTFGSGSGLLDLSLQADDTSLGGILDEIYTPGGEGKGAPAPAGSSAPAEGEPLQDGSASAMEVAAEADHITEAQFPTPQVQAAATAAAQLRFEPEPDAMSNALGVMLFIPLIAILYTSIVAVSTWSNMTPSVVKPVQGYIWYVAVGLGVASLLILGMGAMMGRERAPKAPKPPKVKKEKPPKPVKEKKAK